MRSFEDIASEWFNTVCFCDKYTYRTEKRNALKHLVAFFGKMDCVQREIIPSFLVVNVEIRIIRN